MSFEEIVSKVLTILEKSEQALLVAESVLLILLNRKLNKINVNLTSSPSSSSEDAVPVASSPSKKELKTLKQSAKERALAAVDLYFSDKPDEDLTDGDKRLIAAVNTVMEVDSNV